MSENNNKIINKTFIKIPNSLFTIEKNEIGEEVGVSIFKQIGTEGFTIWSYLLYTQGNQVSAQTNVKRISSFLNRNKETRSKYIAKNGLNDARSIKKYLNFGNQDNDPYNMKNYGFANCSEEYISKILDRSRKTISEYISENNIIQTSLVKIIPQENQEWYDHKTNTNVQKYMPNHYIVHAKYNPENKYYIETNQSKEKIKREEN